MMREAFVEVSPCRTTTTSVNSSSPLGAAARVGDMARWAAAAPANLSLCRSRRREGGCPPDVPPGFMEAFRKKPQRWPLLQPNAAGIVGCCGGIGTDGTTSSTHIAVPLLIVLAGHPISQFETILALSHGAKKF